MLTFACVWLILLLILCTFCLMLVLVGGCRLLWLAGHCYLSLFVLLILRFACPLLDRCRVCCCVFVVACCAFVSFYVVVMFVVCLDCCFVRCCGL